MGNLMVTEDIFKIALSMRASGRTGSLTAPEPYILPKLNQIMCRLPLVGWMVRKEDKLGLAHGLLARAAKETNVVG